MRTEDTMPEPQSSNIQDIAELLTYRLSLRGLLSPQIPRFIKDVQNMILYSGHKEAMLLNDRLDFLGWGEGILDEFTLQLILFVAENQGETRGPSIH